MRNVIRFSMLAACFGAVLFMSSALAQLAPNQTKGFGNNRMVTFTYTQISTVSTNRCLISISTGFLRNRTLTKCNYRFASR